jgi:TPP-dependent pyruvate/acetoin dehydrogenase alpha subunit
MNNTLDDVSSPLVSIFRQSLRIRMIEEEIASKYSEGKMRCPVHLSIGQEIPAALAGFFKEKRDTFVSSHRSHAHFLSSGGSLQKMIAEIYGKVGGCSKGRGGSMHLFDKESGFMGSSAIVGNSIPVGVGIGYSLKMRGDESVSFVFFGDGATEEGVFYESLNFASIHRLPVLFFCENNKYSVYTGLESRQPKSRSIAKVSESLGVPSKRLSDANIENAYAEFKSTLAECRSGGGPRLIEIETYRALEHCGPNEDDHLGYRPIDELNRWKVQDRLTSLRMLLEGRGEIENNQIDIWEKAISLEIQEAFEFAENSAFPTIDSVLEVYA